MTNSSYRSTDAPVEPAVRLSHVRFSYDGGDSWVLNTIDLAINTGERVCVVGANGSGKSTLARLIAGLAAPDDGTVTLLGHQVFDAANSGARGEAYREARRDIGLVFQHPEDQIISTVVADDVAFGPENLGVPSERIGELVYDSLTRVNMDEFAAASPDRLSGGQQQRVAIASALAMRPRLLVLDEPNAMLDSDSRAQVMTAITAAHQAGATIVHITHAMSETLAADRVVVLHHGMVAFDGTPQTLFAKDASTLESWGLERPSCSRIVYRHTPDSISMPSTGSGGDKAIVTASGVSFRFHDGAHLAATASNTPMALQDVDLQVTAGEFVAITGHSGSGKSTFARLLCALETPDDGTIQVAGINTTDRRQRMRLRQTIGYVMQHPERQLFASTIAQDIAFGPTNFGCNTEDTQHRVIESMTALGIDKLAECSPWDCSGGQQRLAAIAGVLACQPQVLVLDEPTASLDTQARRRLMRTLRELNQQGITIIMTTHDLEEAMLADCMVRFDHGRIVEQGAPGDLLTTVDNTDAHALYEAESRSPNLASTNQGSSEPHDKQSTPRPTAKTAHINSPAATSPLARLDPRMKALTVLALMMCMFLITSPQQLAWGALLCLGMMAASRLRPSTALHQARMFIALFVIMGLFNLLFTRTGQILAVWGPITITDDGIWSGILYATRFAMMTLLGITLMAGTTPTQLTDAFSRLLKPLERLGLHVSETSLVMSTALRFVPVLAREARQIAEAQATRGGDVETGGITRRFRAATAMIVPVFAGTLRHATDFGTALEARSYEGGSGRTQWHVLRITHRDWLFVAAAVCWLVVLVALMPLF